MHLVPSDIIRWCFVILLGVVSGGVVSAHAQGLLHGHVMGMPADQDQIQLVGGATVELRDSGGKVVASVTADEHGHYAVKDLAAGNYEYRITADGYDEYGDGRGFEFQSADGVHVLDFVLPGESQKVSVGQLRGNVVHVLNGKPQPLQGATIALRDEEGSVTVVYTDENGDYQKTLSTGTWHVSASSLSFEPKFHPAALTIDSGGQESVDFRFEKQPVTIETVSEVRALLSVQQENAPQADRLPEVRFMAHVGASERPVVGEVRRLSQQDLADMGLSSSGSWMWFQAVPAEPLPAGMSHVEARLEPFDPATSDPKELSAEFSTYFDVVLRHKTAEELNDDDDPSQVDPSKVAIHGHVMGQDEKRNPLGLVPGALIELLDSNGVVVATDQTNEDGYFFVHSLSPGEYTYRLSHRSYANEDAGRGFVLSAAKGLQVMDFFLTQTSRATEVGRLVGTAVDGNQQVVPGTSVIVWNAADPDSRKILRLRDQENFKTSLADGTWLATATAPGYSSTPLAVTIRAGEEAKADLVLAKKSGGDGAGSIEALVAVQRFDHKSGTSDTPEVRFVRQSDNQFVPANVRKLTGEEAAAVGAGSGSWEYFVAQPAQSLAADEYYVEAKLADYHDAKSAVQDIDPLSLVSFHVTLRSTKADDPQQSQGTIFGLVQSEFGDDGLIPTANAVVKLHNTSTGTRVELTTNTKGQYADRTLEPGMWLAAVNTSNFAPYLHAEAITLTAGGKQRVDILLEEMHLEEPPQAIATVAIEKSDSQENSGMPTVQFVNVETKAKCNARLEPIDAKVQQQLADSLGEAGSSWKWFDAFPEKPLTKGKYQVEAALDGFRPDVSDVKPVWSESGDTTTVFYVTLRSEQIRSQPGTILARVWKQYSSDEAGLAEDAQVALKNRATGDVVLAKLNADGNYTVEVPAGEWQASAKVPELPPVIRPQPITVFEGRQSFCELTVQVPPPEPVDLPKVFTFIGVQIPASGDERKVVPEVYFVPKGMKNQQATPRSETWTMVLYKPQGGYERLTEASVVDGSLPSWATADDIFDDEDSNPFGEDPNAITRIATDTADVQAAARRAVAMLNQQQRKNYVLEQVRGCGIQAVAGSNFHLLVEVRPRTDLQDGGGRPIAAMVKSLPENLKTKYGLQDWAETWQWYAAIPEEPMPTGVYHAEATLAGHKPGISDAKLILPGRTTTFDVMLPMLLPEVEVLVYSASQKTPLANVTAKFMNVDRGRSLREAFAIQTDRNGRGSGTLPDGMGVYNILVSGGELEPQGKQVVIDKERMTIPFNVRRTDDPITFAGIVVMMGGSGEGIEMVQETRTRRVQKRIGGLLRTVTEEYQVEVPVAGTQAVEKRAANARIVLMPADDATIAPSIRKPIMANNQGEFQRAEIPKGKYQVSITATDCLPYTGFITLAEDTTNAKFVIEACNKALEQHLVALLTEGWGRTSRHMSAAKRHYDLAKRADPQTPVVDYAMGLAMMQGHRWSDADRFFSQAAQTPMPTATWDRAAEAEVWTKIYRNQIRSGVSAMDRLCHQIYPDREMTNASVETAYVMGVAAGVLKGPWKTEHPGSGVERVDAGANGALQSSHLEAYQRGRDEVLQQYGQLAQKATQAADQAAQDAEEARLREERRIRDRLDVIVQNLKEIKSEADREEAQSTAVCQQAKAEADRLLPRLQRIEAEMRSLYQQQQQLKARLNEIVRQQQMQQQNQREYPQQGGGDVQLPDFFPQGGEGGLMNWGGPGRLLQNQKQVAQNRLDPNLREQERYYTNELLKIARQLQALEPQRQQLANSITKLEATCVQAQRRYQVIYRQLDGRYRQLEKEQEQLLRQLENLEKGGNAKPKEVADLEESLKEFTTYRKFPLADRKREILQQIQGGCDGKTVPPLDIGPGPTPAGVGTRPRGISR